jgi:hypothetical protein
VYTQLGLYAKTTVIPPAAICSPRNKRYFLIIEVANVRGNLVETVLCCRMAGVEAHLRIWQLTREPAENAPIDLILLA